MEEFDLQMAICLDNTEQNFTRLFREVFLRFLRLHNSTIKELEISNEMKKSLQGVDLESNCIPEEVT